VEVVPARQRYAAAVVRARPSSCARPAHDVAVIMFAHRSNGLTGDFACDEKQELDAQSVACQIDCETCQLC
jgi:hypothetical protein